MSTSHLPSPVKFREDINGLRAWAVMAVVLFHFQIPGLSGGFVGVDIFFVISGYLMTAIIIKGVERGDFSITQFYMARVRRILPALLVVIAVLLALGWFWLPTMYYKSLAVESGTAISFTSNVYYFLRTGYFDSAAHEKWLLHTWSLAVEAQFYVLYPLIIVMLWKFKPCFKSLTLILTIILIISFSVNVWLVNVNLSAAFYLLPSRVWELVAGGLVFLLAKQLNKNLKINSILNVIGWVFIVASIIFVNQELQWPGYWALLPVLGASFIIYTHKDNSTLSNNLIAQWTGDRSYSIYLWHWPIVVLLNFTSSYVQWYWIGFAILLSLLLGHISFKLVESPTRKFLSQKSLRKEILIISILILFLIILILTIKLNNLENRFPSEIDLAANESKNFHPDRYKCNGSSAGSPECIYGSKKVGAILLGDSHASSIASSFGTAALQKNMGIILASYNGCPPINDMVVTGMSEDSLCKRFNIWVGSEPSVTRSTLPIVYASRLSSSVLGVNNENFYPKFNFNGIINNKNRDAYLESFQNAYISTVCQYAKERPVYVMRPIPEMDVNVPKTLSLNLLLKKEDIDVKILKSKYLEENEAYINAQNMAQKKCGIKVLNSTKYLCDEKYCYGSKDGRAFYYDDDHLSEYGNKRLVQMFESVFKEKVSQ
ncbi:MAG: acyltransferase [Thiotrichales bacterium]|nr:acyltransferase [Thiotrichales bacterium]